MTRPRFAVVTAPGMRAVVAAFLLALTVPAVAQDVGAAVRGLDACLTAAPANDLEAVQTCYYEAGHTLTPDEGEYVPPPPKTTAEVRGGLDACLAARAALEPELRQMCFYDAANALYVDESEGHDHEMEEDYPVAPSEAVEMALSECIEAEGEWGARCFADATAGYQRITATLGAELLEAMSPEEAAAFREAEAAWTESVARDERVLGLTFAPERYADPDAAADAGNRRDVQMLNLARNRYYWLDALPRG